MSSSFFCVYIALLFSATMRRREESLAQDILDDPLRIAVGDIGKVTNNHSTKEVT